jgi:hypothetical protein
VEKFWIRGHNLIESHGFEGTAHLCTNKKSNKIK